jgi:acetylornithine deacetylase
VGWGAACDSATSSATRACRASFFGAGDLEAAHRPDEWVSVPDLEVAARAYALLALRWLTASP